MSVKTFKIQIKGQVQGVGFRPFVCRIAKEQNLNGSISNNEEGVIITLSTSKEKAHHLLETIINNPPPAAVIQHHSITENVAEQFHKFTIMPSVVRGNINSPLTPDFAICSKCKEDIKDTENKRFGYPFTTCVNCGPRYAITTKFPFERAHTSFRDLKMCRTCETEYKNPNDRRFHSQTNSCADCGIQLQLTDNNGKTISVHQKQIIEKTATLILEGNIIAIKNTNGYLLCCDATNTKVIKQLRIKKKRSHKPFAVLYHTIKSIEQHFQISPQEKTMLTSTIAPIVILKNTTYTAIDVQNIAPGLHQTGVMLPSSALLELLMTRVKRPIICTSGNSHGSPIISNNKQAQEQLKTIADYVLHHNMQIQFSQDDSVLKLVDGKQIILRRSRGFAPNYLEDNSKIDSRTLAMGAHLKSTFSLVPNAHIYVSQYFGNLDNFDVLERYQKTIKQQLKVFNGHPKTVLIDAHPNYQSSLIGQEIAQKNKAQLIKIQHHKAHFASVLGEHNLFHSKEKILGVIWDGTGYGDDDAIWGGEFFIFKNKTIERVSHFEYYNWLANDKMSKEPRLALLSLLDDENRCEVKSKFSETEWKVYTKMLETNVLKTSSVGRLFDAVASALDLKDRNTYEAEGAMLLENCALNYTENNAIDFLNAIPYDYVPSKLLLTAIFKAYKEGLNKAHLAYSFIYTLAKSIIKLSEKYKIKTIVCSGGVFQNSVLLKILIDQCENHKIKLKINCKLSANDENIAFGQIMYFQHIKN